MNNKLGRKHFYGWKLAKTKGNLKPESSMKIAWNTCDREFGGLTSVSAMKTSTNGSFENFQRQQLPFREIYVKYFEKNSIWFIAFCIAFSITNLLPMKSKASNKHSIHM